MGIFQRLFGGDPTAALWTWFASQAPRMTFPPARAQIDELGRLLHKIHNGLAFQIGQFDGVNVLEISAEGDRDLVHAVQNVCTAAPPVPGWRVVPFRQRSTEAGSVRVNGIDLSMSNMWFILEDGSQPTNLVIFVDGFDEHPELAQAASILLDAAVGEYVMLTKVGAIAIADGSQCPDHAAPLTTLHDTLTGIDTPREDTWAFAEVTLANGNPLTVTFRTGAPATVDRSQLATRIAIQWRYPYDGDTGMPSREHLHAMREIERIAATTDAILLLSKTGECARESIFQVKDSTAFLAELCELTDGLDLTYATQVAPDPTWSLWRTTVKRMEQKASTRSN